MRYGGWMTGVCAHHSHRRKAQSKGSELISYIVLDDADDDDDDDAVFDDNDSLRRTWSVSPPSIKQSSNQSIDRYSKGSRGKVQASSSSSMSRAA